MNAHTVLLGCLLTLWLMPTGAAAETAIERSAARLLQTTVTVRIAPPAKEQDGKKEEGVTVCSGTSLGAGEVMTFLRPAQSLASAADLNYRVTLPGGEQAAAQPAVIDHYSGLVLLKLDASDLPGLKRASELPAIGGTVLAASASGIEKPLVSMGVLSGVDRSISGTLLPPMIQCDISTTKASCGAPVTNAAGELLGIIAATEAPGERFGWTYAIPASHVERVRAARAEDRLVVLVRRRPSLGLQLGSGPTEGSVQVERVIPGGPADKAGIRPGELVFAAQQRKVRSAYQVVALILKHQPGDRVALVVGNDQSQRQVEVTLGGSPSAASDAAEKLAQPHVQVGPQVNLRLATPHQIEVRNRVAELSMPAPTPRRVPGSEVELLRSQLEAYQRVIQAMQEERLQLKQEIDALKKELEGDG